MRYLACDLGAESGRIVAGNLEKGRLNLELVHRFPNQPVWLPEGLRWDILGIFR
ncbi:MAG: Rhamnulokinase [candidate division TA06 bacterium ADurb.Bin417]|uniref:Rhamnulokinase n=1 Tax=candidate division TA06 bacterium ADurb.Bin417 TaxID=1852828 RepID=A0A1V5M921_UNCT6|nr:MAG: Rhamnulokinase [candidate division TA06 bacterium ADurb.Bin417]